jgi:hypothetical protein
VNARDVFQEAANRPVRKAYSVPRMADIWQFHMRELTGKAQPDLHPKAFRQLKLFAEAALSQEIDPTKLLVFACEHWQEFTAKVAPSWVGPSPLPELPDVGFMLVCKQNLFILWRAKHRSNNT